MKINPYIYSTGPFEGMITTFRKFTAIHLILGKNIQTAYRTKDTDCGSLLIELDLEITIEKMAESDPEISIFWMGVKHTGIFYFFELNTITSLYEFW